MKKLLTLSLIILSLSASAQLGLKLGSNFSYFSKGAPIYGGINQGYRSITGGIFHKSKHLQIELDYAQGGAKNSVEGKRTFKTYNILIPVMYVAHAGDVNFQVGGYISRIVGVSNSDLFTPGINFSWRVGKNNWDWWQTYDVGLSGGIGWNMHNAYLELHARRGLVNVRNDKKGWNGLYDPAYDGCRNAALELAVYFPFN